MITIKADFNHLDGQGRLILSDLLIHQDTPFEELARRQETILFRQGEEHRLRTPGQRSGARLGRRSRLG